MTQELITVGITGLGKAGQGIHIKALREDKRFKIVAVADPAADRGRAMADEFGCDVFPDLPSLLAASEAELIVVSTPTNFHEGDALLALQANRHCVLEKPMAMSYRGAVRIHEQAQRAGKLLAVNHALLFREEYHFLKEVIGSGILGEVFEISFNWSSYRRRSDWQTLVKNGGGHLANHGTHALSLMLPLLGGNISALLGSMKLVKDAGDAEDHAHILMKSDNGRTGQVIVSTCLAIPGPRFSVYGSYGSLVSNNDGTAQLKYCNPQALPVLAVDEGPRQKGAEEVIPWVEETRKITARLPYRGFYDNIYHSIRDGAAFLAPSNEALAVARVIEWTATGCDPAPG